MRELARVTGETAHATVYDYPYSVTILIAEGDAPVRGRVLVGSRQPLHASASGKVYLAHEQERVIAAYLADHREALTTTTITSADVLQRVLVEVREQGYGIDQGESYDGICGIAAPVFDFSGQVVGCLSHHRRDVAARAQSGEDARGAVARERGCALDAPRMGAAPGHAGGGG